MGAAEDYLTAIWRITAGGSSVRTSALARWLGVSAPSATAMIKRLAGEGFVAYKPYRGAELTSTGQRRALRLIRHHRVVELFLAEVLGLPWDRVHEEAERWSGALSDDVVERMYRHLGEPAADVHGQPIPSVDGKLTMRDDCSLAEGRAPGSWRITEVNDRDPDFLKYCETVGLVPGALIEVLAAEPYQGTVRVRVGHETIALDEQVATNVRVVSWRLEGGA